MGQGQIPENSSPGCDRRRGDVAITGNRVAPNGESCTPDGSRDAAALEMTGGPQRAMQQSRRRVQRVQESERQRLSLWLGTSVSDLYHCKNTPVSAFHPSATRPDI